MMNWQWVVLILGILLSLEIFALLWGVLIRPQDRELEFHKLAQEEVMPEVVKIDIPTDDDTIVKQDRWEP